MAALPKKKLTGEEYLAIERKAGFKSEFYRGELFAMAGATGQHNRIKENCAGELFGRLKGGSCESFTSDQRVRVDPSGLYTYPDIIIVCGEVQYTDDTQDTITNPICIMEVLSSSTEAYDRGAKFRLYRHVPTLQEYILISQTEAVIEQFVRQPNGLWVLTTYDAISSVLRLAAVAVEIPLADIYSRVTFPATNPIENQT
jgi:Uma2 family endonuclease